MVETLIFCRYGRLFLLVSAEVSHISVSQVFRRVTQDYASGFSQALDTSTGYTSTAALRAMNAIIQQLSQTSESQKPEMFHTPTHAQSSPDQETVATDVATRMYFEGAAAARDFISTWTLNQLQPGHLFQQRYQGIYLDPRARIPASSWGLGLLLGNCPMYHEASGSIGEVESST